MLLQEVKEETNLDVVVEKLLAIGSIIGPDKEHEIVLSYLCKPKSDKVMLEKKTILNTDDSI